MNYANSTVLIAWLALILWIFEVPRVAKCTISADRLTMITTIEALVTIDCSISRCSQKVSLIALCACSIGCAEQTVRWAVLTGSAW